MVVLFRYAVVLIVGVMALIVGSSCGRPVPPPQMSAPSETREEHPLNRVPGIVQGRLIAADTAAAWKAGVMEFRAEDTEVRLVATAGVKGDGTFEITLPPLAYDIPFAVIAFDDRNGNDRLDRGEDFIGGKSRGPGYEGSNLFLFTEGGTFVGDRSWDLSEVIFDIDVSLR